MQTIQLSGKTQAHLPARVGSEVKYFTNDNQSIIITGVTDAQLTVQTTKGKYLLKKHATLNIYQGECNGHKTQVHLKAISGWIKFW